VFSCKQKRKSEKKKTEFTCNWKRKKRKWMCHRRR